MDRKAAGLVLPTSVIKQAVGVVIPTDVIAHSTSRSRLIAGILGPVLLGVGSGVSISAGFGSFGFSVLLDGLNQVLHAPLWFLQGIITLILFWISWRWARIPLGMGTLPALLLIGPAISLGATVTPGHLPLLFHMAAFVFGLMTFALGISLSAAAALGPDGVTALSLAAEKRLYWPVPRANFVWNVLAIGLGAMLGGNVGPATVVGLIITPLLIKCMLPVMRQHMVD